MNAHNLFDAALTVDVEDGINIAMADFFNLKIPPTNRVIQNVEIILRICNENNVKGTFFILGEIAVEFPNLIKKIHEDGHEIGLHGLRHDQIFKLNPERLFNDLSISKDILENLIGQKVHGFRAPAFSIDESTSWALEILAELGFQYDSSIFPASTARYGWKEIPEQICQLKLANGKSIIEVPLSVIKIFGITIPACGGGYLRYFPYLFSKYAFKKVSSSRPVIIYLHPYELDIIRYPDFFYEAKRKAQLKSKLQLMFYMYKKNTVEDKLKRLIIGKKFGPLKEIVHLTTESGRMLHFDLTQLI